MAYGSAKQIKRSTLRSISHWKKKKMYYLGIVGMLALLANQHYWLTPTVFPLVAEEDLSEIDLDEQGNSKVRGVYWDLNNRDQSVEDLERWESEMGKEKFFSDDKYIYGPLNKDRLKLPNLPKQSWDTGEMGRGPLEGQKFSDINIVFNRNVRPEIKIQY